MRHRSALVLLVVLTTALATSAPGWTIDLDPPPAPVPSPPSEVRVALEDAGGLDRVVVAAGQGSPTAGAAGVAWACVSAIRSRTHTESRGGQDLEVTTERREQGCEQGPAYRFDPLTWQADVRTTIATDVVTIVVERGPTGARVVERHEARASAAVELRWLGAGDDDLDAWVAAPDICYTMPPSPCHYDAGVAVSRTAEVAGDVRLGGLGAVVSPPPGHEGAMRWWAGT